MNQQPTTTEELLRVRDELRTRLSDVERQIRSSGAGEDTADVAPPLTLGTSEERFRKLLEFAPDGVVVVSTTGRIEFVNRQTELLFGYAGTDLVGQKLEALLPERFRIEHVGHRDRYFASPRTRPMGAGLELHARRKDGTEFLVEVSLSPLDTPDGPIVVAAIRDMTERKRFEHALREKNAELERALRAKDLFLEGMSHELRTPLNAIIGFTGTLLMGLPGPLNPDQEEQLKTVEDSATHLLSMINNLLDLTKIESGRVEIVRERVLSREVASEIEAALGPLAVAKGLTFEVAVDPADATVLTDRRAVTQIVMNLMHNAIKFTERGYVRLEFRQSHTGPRVVTEIRVHDTGPGIQPEDRPGLFEAFRPLRGSGRSQTQGAGVGLYLSRKLADLLGGRLGLTSEPGRGCTFTLALEE